MDMVIQMRIGLPLDAEQVAVLAHRMREFATVLETLAERSDVDAETLQGQLDLFDLDFDHLDS